MPQQAGQFTASDIDPTGAFRASDAADPMDFTNRYNTPIRPDQQQAFQRWAQSVGQDPVKGRYDYDLQGAFLDNLQAADNGHLNDKFKKPNHPTFSTGSMYNGADGYQGGQWSQMPGTKSWVYQPSPSNMKFFSPGDYQDYWGKVEAYDEKGKPTGNTLALPPQAPRIPGLQ